MNTIPTKSTQLQSLAMLNYQSYEHGYELGQVFFALWVLPLGVLIYRSRFIPKAFGVLFVVEEDVNLKLLFEPLFIRSVHL